MNVLYNNTDYLLINPPGLKKYNKIKRDFCLGLGYIDAYIRKTKKYKGAIINGYFNNLSIENIVDIICEANPKILGISCNYYSAVPATVTIVNELRHRNFKEHICLGGHGCFTSKDTFLENLEIDSLCVGDGEIVFYELLDSIFNKTFDYNVKGFYYKKNGLIINDYVEVNLPSIENLPFPTRPGDDGYPIFSSAKENLDSVAFNLATSRGCAYSCTYCDISSFYKKTRRVRSPQDVVYEISYLYNRFKINHFSFSDDNFIGGSVSGRKRALEFVKLIGKLDFKIIFSMEVRVNDIDFDIIKSLSDAGLFHVNLGVESGSQAILNRWRKGITVEQSYKAIEILQILDIKYNVNFILYDMYTSIDELKENYEFLYKTKSFEKCEDYFSLFYNSLGVIENTPIAFDLKKAGLQKSFHMRLATEDEQKILDDYHPVYGYNFINKEMDYFHDNQNYWIAKVSKIIAYIENNNGNQNGLRKLCMKLFKQSIDSAEKFNNCFGDLDNIIDTYIKINKISIQS